MPSRFRYDFVVGGVGALQPRLCPKCKSAYWETAKRPPLRKRGKK